MIFDKLGAVQQALKIWRGVVLVLTMVMLMVSIISNDDMAVISLVIFFFALILFQMQRLPTTSYQLFMMLLVAYTIFLGGQFLEGFYDKEINQTYIIKNVYNILTLIIFTVVLWRHYQKDQLNISLDDQLPVNV